MQKKLYEILETFSQETKQTIYVILDGVKYPMLWSDLEEGMLHYDMLFREEVLQKELAEVAPFFVSLDFESKSTQEQSRILLDCYAQGGALFFASDKDFNTVLEAMRELFYVYTPEGDKGYMRFYDPKIFRHYITQKDDNIRYALFSEVACYWCEDVEDSSMVHQYTKDGTYTYQKQSIDLKEKELLKDA